MSWSKFTEVMEQDIKEPKQSTFLEDWLELDRAFSSGSGDEEIGTGFSSQNNQDAPPKALQKHAA